MRELPERERERVISYLTVIVRSAFAISRNGPYIGGHLAFCFQIEL